MDRTQTFVVEKIHDIALNLYVWTSDNLQFSKKNEISYLPFSTLLIFCDKYPFLRKVSVVSLLCAGNAKYTYVRLLSLKLRCNILLSYFDIFGAQQLILYR